jgi:hypothetical protein
VLLEGPRAAGRHDLVFEAQTLPVGVYVVRALIGAEVQTARLTVVR